MTIHHQILKDDNGNNLGVFLPMADYQSLIAIIERIEDYEDILDFDLAEKSDDEIIPVEQAFKEIETRRNDL